MTYRELAIKFIEMEYKLEQFKSELQTVHEFNRGARVRMTEAYSSYVSQYLALIEEGMNKHDKSAVQMHQDGIKYIHQYLGGTGA